MAFDRVVGLGQVQQQGFDIVVESPSKHRDESHVVPTTMKLGAIIVVVFKVLLLL